MKCDFGYFKEPLLGIKKDRAIQLVKTLPFNANNID